MEVEVNELTLRYKGLRVLSSHRWSRLLASMAADGQQSAVLAVRDEAGALVLVDGYARVAALGKLGRDLVRVTLLDMPEAEALILTHRLESKGGRSALEEGWLIAVLIDVHGLPMRAVAARLRRSVSWVSRRRALVQVLPMSAQQAVREGRLPAHAAAKYLAPLARANATHCDRLVRSLGELVVTDRQVERLYRAYKQAEGQTRERILAEPRLFLRAQEAARSEPLLPVGDPGQPLLNDLEGIAGLSHRARRRVREGLLHELDGTRRVRIGRAAQQARLAFESLCELLTEEPPCSTGTPAQPS